MVGAGEGAASHCAEGVGVLGVVGPIRCLLHGLHEAADEEVVLQRRDALLREDGRLPTHWTGQRQALGRDVVLEASGQGGGGVKGMKGRGGVSAPLLSPAMGANPSPHRCAVTFILKPLWLAHASCPNSWGKRPHLSQLSGNTSLTSLKRSDIPTFLTVCTDTSSPFTGVYKPFSQKMCDYLPPHH